MNILGIDLDETLISNYPSGDYSIRPDVLKYLGPIQRQLGWRFVLITARPTDSDKTPRNLVVEEILDNIQRTCQVVFDYYICTSYNPKGKVASDNECKFMIDDNPEYVRDCVNTRNKPIPILYGSGARLKNVGFRHLSAYTWKDIYEYLASERWRKDIRDWKIMEILS